MDHFVLGVLSGYLFLHRLSMKKESCGYHLKWPVTGQSFQNPNWPAVLSFPKIFQIEKNS